MQESLAAIECAIAEAMGVEPTEKAKRRRAINHSGTVTPKNTKTKHEQAENTSSGHAGDRASLCASGLSLTWLSGWIGA